MALMGPVHGREFDRVPYKKSGLEHSRVRQLRVTSGVFLEHPIVTYNIIKNPVIVAVGRIELHCETTDVADGISVAPFWGHS